MTTSTGTTTGIAAWSSRLDGVRITGEFRRSPFSGTYYPAQMEWAPMTRPQEYAQSALFEHASEAPVIMSVSQRHHLLAELVHGLRNLVGGLSCMLVRLYGPDFNVQLPADLLEKDVLLVHDPQEVLPLLLDSGRSNIVVIQQDLRADGMDRGTNNLSVSLLKPEPAEEQFERFATWVKGHPLLEALSEPRLETLGRMS